MPENQTQNLALNNIPSSRGSLHSTPCSPLSFSQALELLFWPYLHMLSMAYLSRHFSDLGHFNLSTSHATELLDYFEQRVSQLREHCAHCYHWSCHLVGLPIYRPDKCSFCQNTANQHPLCARPHSKCRKGEVSVFLELSFWKDWEARAVLLGCGRGSSNISSSRQGERQPLAWWDESLLWCNPCLTLALLTFHQYWKINRFYLPYPFLGSQISLDVRQFKLGSGMHYQSSTAQETKEV